MLHPGAGRDVKMLRTEFESSVFCHATVNLGVLKSINTIIQIQPNETVTISGFVRKKRSVDSAFTEQTQGASSRIGVCPCVASLDKDQTYQRVHLSAKVNLI